jgi:hypothetical protein
LSREEFMTQLFNTIEHRSQALLNEGE